MTHVVVFGATSAIAQAVLRLYAREGAQFFLVGRNPERLQAVAADLVVRGAHGVATRIADLADCALHASLVEQARAALGSIDLVLLAHGTLSKQDACVGNADLALREISGNFLSPASILTHVANVLETQGHGTIAVIGSVAGDRGRRSNYVYGSAKAGLGVFVEGLRQRMAPSGVTVILIKPGFVDTPMTAALPRAGPLWVRPDRVARDIRRGIQNGAAVVYTPWFWRGIMCIIRALPEAVFKRLPI